MHDHPLFIIARVTFLEGVRNRLMWLNVAVLVLSLGAAQFLAAVSITEAREFQAAFLGSVLRLFAVLMLSLFVVTSVMRELNDKGLYLLLSLPIPRWTYLIGRWLGFALLALASACLFGLALVFFAPWPAAAMWAVSLGCELLIVIGVCLICLLGFNQATLALCAALGVYLAARTIETLKLMTHGPFAQADGAFAWFSDRFLAGLSHLLPDLSSFGRSEWLVYPGVGWSELGPVAVQTLIYVPVLLAVGLFDLYRRNL